jgi:hypothetical protein
MTRSKMKIIFLVDFQLNFLTQYQKPQVLCNAKVLSQEDLKFTDLVLQGVKNPLFFTSNAIILQSMWSTF